MEEQLLDVGQITPYPELEMIKEKKEPYEKLWHAAVKFHQMYDKWMNGPLLDVNAEEVEEEVCWVLCVCEVSTLHVKCN